MISIPRELYLLRRIDVFAARHALAEREKEGRSKEDNASPGQSFELQHQACNEQPRRGLRGQLHDRHDVGSRLHGKVVFRVLQGMSRFMRRDSGCRYAWRKVHLLA